MTKEEKAKICEILGYSKAIQLLKPADKQTQKMYEEIDKRLAELLSATEEPPVEKKVIEEHHYYNHGSWWSSPTTTYTYELHPLSGTFPCCNDNNTINTTVYSDLVNLKT